MGLSCIRTVRKSVGSRTVTAGLAAGEFMVSFLVAIVFTAFSADCGVCGEVCVAVHEYVGNILYLVFCSILVASFYQFTSMTVSYQVPHSSQSRN